MFLSLSHRGQAPPTVSHKYTWEVLFTARGSHDDLCVAQCVFLLQRHRAATVCVSAGTSTTCLTENTKSHINHNNITMRGDIHQESYIILSKWVKTMTTTVIYFHWENPKHLHWQRKVVNLTHKSGTKSCTNRGDKAKNSYLTVKHELSEFMVKK